MTVGLPRLPLWVDPLIAEAKRRARHRRLLVGGAVLAAVVAGLALTLGLPGGSSGGPGSASAGFNSASLSGQRASANQARLERGGPVKLLPGRVSTDALGTNASFEVFDHWYGWQEPGILRLARHLATGGYEVSLDTGGIEVNALDFPLARSVRKLETTAGIRVHDVSSVRLGGHSGRRYSFSSDHGLMFRPGVQLSAAEHDVILLGVGHRTLVIRKMDAAVRALRLSPDHDQTLREAERVIQSFRFHS
jgi:hypothetical protein